MQTRSLKVLDRSEIKEIERIIEKNYGTEIDLERFGVFKTKDEKVWIASKKIFEIELEKIAVNSIGMYVGRLKRNEKIHLSTEACQMIGKTAKKNVAIVSDAEKFLSGSNLKPDKEINCDYHNFVIVRTEKEILGCSLLTEEGIKNLVPRSRRIIKPIQREP
jgi:NOL1/NOP2/fmu family ribosome biogenesis protein